MASNQQFCLRWNNHQSTLISVFDHLLESGTLVDCTLAAEGQFLKAHKVVLSACSPYLEALLSQHYEKHPILILKDVTFHELKSMLDYMYRGEVNISQEQLGTFLKAAESLQIKGLTDCGAMSETRDLERSREMEHIRIPGDFNRIDRSLGTVLSKRIDVRKQIPIQPRPRSPLVGLPANFMMNADHRKMNKHPLSQDVNLGTSNAIRNREGSLSPTVKRKRPTSYVSQNEDPSAPLPVENNVDQNHHLHKGEKIQDSSPLPQSLSDSAPVTANVSETKKQSESENSVDSEVIKREMKMENVEFTDDVQNEDSVEDLTVDEEEEEMDEMDISQPGPSTASNSLVAGVPWHNTGEGNGDDGLLVSQQDSQGTGKKYTALQIRNWDAWSSVLHPMMPTLLHGALTSYSPSEEPKGVECNKCGRHYKLKSSLRNHQKWECGKDPQFRCPYCNYRAKQKMHVARHIERMHREKLELLEMCHNQGITIKDEGNAAAFFQQDAAQI